MRTFNYKTDNVLLNKNEMLLANEDADGVCLVKLHFPEGKLEKIMVFSGSKCMCLNKIRDMYFVSIDNTLYCSKDLLEWKSVLQVKSGNFIWHMCETQRNIIAQEYGESPTYLYKSTNGFEWKEFLSNIDIDKTSRHWHSVGYDKNQDCVYATLGDGNITRVILLKSNFSWSPLYTGPWQFVPIAISQDKAVFGMDSSLLTGGIGIYSHDKGWQFSFQSWNNKDIQRGQICDLKLLSNGIWIAALGSPSSVLISRDLRSWVVAQIIENNHDFNHNMNISEGDDFVAISTHKNLIVCDKQELSSLSLQKPSITPCKPYKQILMGPVRIAKRRFFAYIGQNINQTYNSKC